MIDNCLDDPFMRFAALFLAIGLATLGASALLAHNPDSAPPGSEAEKAAVIRGLFRAAPPANLLSFFSEDGTQLERPPKWVAWCERFMTDFRAQNGIEYVEPVAKSQSYDDPAFRIYQNQCPQLAFNARSDAFFPEDVPGPRGEWLKSLPPHMPDGSPMRDLQFGTRDFKLFEGDYDNDAGDDDAWETIFFADGYYSYWNLVARDERFALEYPPLDRSWNESISPGLVPDAVSRDYYGEYRLVDLNRCQTKPLAQPASRYYSSQGQSKVSSRFLINGLIRYRGQYYLFDLRMGDLAKPEDDRSHSLSLIAIQPTLPPERSLPRIVEGPPSCEFSRH